MSRRRADPRSQLHSKLQFVGETGSLDPGKISVSFSASPRLVSTRTAARSTVHVQPRSAPFRADANETDCDG